MGWNKEELDGLYSAIFARKSVRKYNPRPLEPELLHQLEEAAQKVFVPFDTSLGLRLLPPAETKGMLKAKAPHYLAIYASPGPMSAVCAGFAMQQLDLWLSQKGVGRCWNGGAKATVAAGHAGLEYVIMLAFGVPEEALYRGSPGEFKRKPISAISESSSCDDLLEVVRLAPSAVNLQPWKLFAAPDAIDLFCSPSGLGKLFPGGLSRVDMGIALCHLWLSARHEGVFSGISLTPPQHSPKGHEYIATVSLRPREHDGGQGGQYAAPPPEGQLCWLK